MGADRLATAKAQAQDYAQTAQQKAAEHLERVSRLPLHCLWALANNCEVSGHSTARCCILGLHGKMLRDVPALTEMWHRSLVHQRGCHKFTGYGDAELWPDHFVYLQVPWDALWCSEGL